MTLPTTPVHTFFYSNTKFPQCRCKRTSFTTGGLSRGQARGAVPRVSHPRAARAAEMEISTRAGPSYVLRRRASVHVGAPLRGPYLPCASVTPGPHSRGGLIEEVRCGPGS